MPFTVDDTIARDLRASLNLRNGVPAGLTWGDFQAAMKLLGVKDTDRLASVEYGCGQFGSGCITRDDANDGIEIREKR